MLSASFARCSLPLPRLHFQLQPIILIRVFLYGPSSQASLAPFTSKLRHQSITLEANAGNIHSGRIAYCCKFACTCSFDDWEPAPATSLLVSSGCAESFLLAASLAMTV